MNFKSDNIGPISPEIMQEIIQANQGNKLCRMHITY
jgi:threonine aldolase